MDEKWLMPGAIVPVDPDTTKALVDEIKRLIGIIGGMALQKCSWVGLTDEEVKDIVWNMPYEPGQDEIRAIEAKLKEKNG